MELLRTVEAEQEQMVTSYNGDASGGQSGAYPAQDFRGCTAGANGWVYIEYG